MAAKKKDEGALRKQVEQTAAKVHDLRDRFAKDPDNKQLGRQLLTARQKASDALAALWDAVPEEKPPPQHIQG